MPHSLSLLETAMANRADLLSTFIPHSSMSYNTTVARNLKGNSARLVCNLRSAWALGSQAEDQEKGNKERGKPSTEHRQVVHSAMSVSQNKSLLGPAAKAETPHPADPNLSRRHGSVQRWLQLPSQARWEVWFQEVFLEVQPTVHSFCFLKDPINHWNVRSFLLQPPFMILLSATKSPF